MIICKKCGTENYEENKFCRSCGSALENEESVMSNINGTKQTENNEGKNLKTISYTYDSKREKTGVDKLLFIYKLAMLGLMVGCMILCFIPYGKVMFYKVVIKGTFPYIYADLQLNTTFVAKILYSGSTRGTIGIIFFILCCLILVFSVVSLLVKNINKKIPLFVTGGSSLLLFVFGLLTFIFNIEYITSHISSLTLAEKLINSGNISSLYDRYNNFIPVDVPYNLFVLYLVLIFSLIALAGSVVVIILYFTKFNCSKNNMVNATVLNNNIAYSNESIKGRIELSEEPKESVMPNNNVIEQTENNEEKN